MLAATQYTHLRSLMRFATILFGKIHYVARENLTDLAPMVN
jgi:hypothetical protein